MEWTEILNSANSGDVDAMLQLANGYLERREINEAIKWADKAAEAGNVNGMYKAANLHSIRMTASKEMAMWGLVYEDCKAVQNNSGILIQMVRNGKLDIEKDIYSSLVELFRDGLYCEALYWYLGEKQDARKASALLMDLNETRESILCAQCLFDQHEHDAAYKKLRMAAKDAAYANMDRVDQAVYSLGMMTLAGMERENGEYELAMAILQQAIGKLNEDEFIQPLRNELGKYRKKLFGGWKYI